LQDQFSLLERCQLMKVAQELKEAHIARQVGFADTPKDSQVRLEQGKEALRSVLMGVIALFPAACTVRQ
jgi:hypothetical protein